MEGEGLRRDIRSKGIKFSLLRIVARNPSKRVPFTRVPSADSIKLSCQEPEKLGYGETITLSRDLPRDTATVANNLPRKSIRDPRIIQYTQEGNRHISQTMKLNEDTGRPLPISFYFYQFDCGQRLTIASSNRQPSCRQRSCWCPMTHTMYQYTTNGWRTRHFVMLLPLRGSL